MKYILHIPADLPDVERLHIHPPSGIAWDEVFRGDAGELIKRFDVVLKANKIHDIELTSNDGHDIAFWCQDIAVFQQRPDHTTGTVIFSPNNLALLDHERLTRTTLVAATPLKAGDVIRSENLKAVVGEAGIASSMQDELLGRTAAYDIPLGQPLDFGWFL